MKIDFKAIARLALANSDKVLSQIVPGGARKGGEYVVKNPNRYDSSPGSFKINTTSGAWADFATGERGGDLVSLTAFILNIRQYDAALYLYSMIRGG